MIVVTDAHTEGAPVPYRDPHPDDRGPAGADRWHRWEGLWAALGLLFSVLLLCAAAGFALSVLLTQRGLGVLVVP